MSHDGVAAPGGRACAVAAASRGQSQQFVIQHSGPMGSAGQQSTAAAFFARNKGRAPLAKPVVATTAADMNTERLFDFASVLGKCPPAAPSSLLRRMAEDDGEKSAQGKVRVVVRVANSGLIDEKKGASFKFDKKKKQVRMLFFVTYLLLTFSL